MPVANDHVLEVAQLQRIDALPEPQIDAELGEPHAEVAQRLRELLLAGNALRQVELAADLLRGIEQRHRMAALGCRRRRRETRRTRTHDRHPLARRSGPHHEFGLAPGVRIDEAARQLALEDVIEAGLVAARCRC